MRLGSLGHSGQGRLSKSDLSLCDGFDTQDFYNWNSLVHSDAFKKYQREDAQGPLGLAKGYEIGFYRAMPARLPEKAPKHGSRMKAVGVATAGLVGAGAAYAMLSDSDGDGVPNYAELFGEKPTLPAPYVIVDSDLDGLPDDLEERWGYSTSEKDVRLKYWVQNPEENKSLVDTALEQVLNDYREKNPLHINIHTYYGGEMPKGAVIGTEEYYEFADSTQEEWNRFAKFLIDEYNDPTGSAYSGNLDDVYFVRGFFLENGDTDLGTGGAAVKGSFFFVATELGGKPRPINYTAGDTMHELGHNFGLDHSPIPESVMYGGDKFFEKEWAFLNNEPLIDFRPNPIVAKYVPE